MRSIIATACDTLAGIAARHSHPYEADAIREWIAALNTIKDDIAAAAQPLSPNARMRRVE